MKLHQNNLYHKDLDKTIKHVCNFQKICGKSIILTGVTGTIGSYVADTLIRYNKLYFANIKIYLAGRDLHKLQAQYSECDNVEFLQYDLHKPIEFNVNVDYIIHIAGNAHPAAFNKNPVETTIGNINSTFELLEYLREHHGSRLLYVSSGEVYGQGNLLCNSFEENYAGYIDTLSPRSSYPLSKRMTENLCASYSKQYDLETVIVRPCHTYGPCITSTDNRAHVQFLNNALEGKDIILKSPGSQLRSYNYVGDCASGLLTVLLNGVSCEAYNLANPKSTLTIAQLAEMIAKVESKNVIFENPSSLDIANRSPIPKQVMNTKKIEDLGWTPAFDIKEGISHTLDILKEMKG